MDRLSNKTLARVSAAKLPRYDRASLTVGIVHLGIGAFHRAHQAWYTDTVLAGGDTRWGILGCSLRSSDVREQLGEQDGLYALVERGAEGERRQIVGSVVGVLVAPDDPKAVVMAMADPRVSVVSITITEKGYCLDPATGRLNLAHPAIVADLKFPAAPSTALGLLVAALAARRAAGVPSFTALSCDNLPHNGRVLAAAVIAFAEALDPDLASWISINTRFPSSMVDRIVPATTSDDRDAAARALGVRDEGVVLAEPFSQWVIEDSFCGERPAWEKAGALVVSDVAPYEQMKLRLLNGSHSLLAYSGYLAGYETISDVMQNAAFVNMCAVFMATNAAPTLSLPASFDIQGYQYKLLERFSNPGLRHRTWQIAMDGSQKLPQRILDSARDQLARGGDIELHCLAIAAWARYISGVDERGAEIDVQDPLAIELRSLSDRYPLTAGEPNSVQALVTALLDVESVFGRDLPNSERFASGVIFWLREILEHGIKNAVERRFSKC